MRLVLCIHGKEKFDMIEHEHYYWCDQCENAIGKSTAHRKPKPGAKGEAIWQRHPYFKWWIRVH